MPVQYNSNFTVVYMTMFTRKNVMFFSSNQRMYIEAVLMSILGKKEKKIINTPVNHGFLVGVEITRAL